MCFMQTESLCFSYSERNYWQPLL